LHTFCEKKLVDKRKDLPFLLESLGAERMSGSDGGDDSLTQASKLEEWRTGWPPAGLAPLLVGTADICNKNRTGAVS
jgi:hypothetical protein